jgi:hypothetical protein
MRFVGSALEVLVEENQEGLTDNYIRVTLPNDRNYRKGQLYNLIV